MGKTTKIASVGKQCVACGCCAKVCPMNAIYVNSGVNALVDSEKCVGCGKCAKICPADVITVMSREDAV